jgi:competence protein ComEC
MVPVIGFVVVPVGLASVCMNLISPEAAFLCMKACTVILEKSIHVITVLSEQSFAAVKTVTPNLFEICFAYFILWGLLNLISIKLRTVKGDVDRKSNRLPVAVTVTVIAAGVLCADVFYWVYTRYWHKDLRITVLDVGQGNAALLELPGGHNLLIDGGGFSDNAVFDTGRMIVAPFLLRKKIKTIDTILLSHAHSDHLNGLIYIAEHFHVKQAITNHEQSRSSGYQQFVSVLKRKGIVHCRFQSLDRNFIINNVGFSILHPEKDFTLRNKQEGWRNLNNNSIVVKVVFGRHAFLFPGDIMVMGERALAESSERMLKSDVLLVPHHGSKASSSPLFLSRVDPDTAIISTGWMNRFGFPSEAVLKRYQAMGCNVYRTDVNGAVEIWSDGEHLKIQPMLPGSN